MLETNRPNRDAADSILPVKIGWAIVLGAIGIAALLGMAILLGIGWWQYSSGYSDASFASIKKGMTQQQVTAILGKPFSVSLVEHRLYKVKTSDGELKPVVIAYDGDGTVSLDSPEDAVVRARQISVCTTRADAEAALHAAASTLKEYQYHWHFSRVIGFTWDDYSRDVVFDSNGRVVKTERHDSEW